MRSKIIKTIRQNREWIKTLPAEKQRPVNQLCPFTHRWWRKYSCLNSCGYIFEQWREETLFTYAGNLVDLTAHPCNMLGSDEVLRIMKEKFPELY